MACQDLLLPRRGVVHNHHVGVIKPHHRLSRSSFADCSYVSALQDV
jgi:hypothetical protein